MKQNILLIVLDCVRSDILGSAGCRTVRIPAIDMIASEGARFSQAICHAPYTTPSIASILTGLYPFNHGIRLLIGQHLHQSIPTIGTILQETGYATAGFPSVFVLNKESGLCNGFKHYDDQIETIREGFRGPWRPGEMTTDRVISFLRKHVMRTPFFAFIHYFDAHDYTPGCGDSLINYQNKINEVDKNINCLISALKESNLWDNTIVVVTADHGDGFGEHELHGHGTSLYDETLRVPFIIRAPQSIAPGLIIEQQVRSIDIFPTILDLIGLYQSVQEKGIQFDGVSLMQSIEGKELNLSAYAETSPLQLFTGDILEAKMFQGVEMMCVRTKDKKYIYKTKNFNQKKYDKLIRKEKDVTYIKIMKSILHCLPIFRYSENEELYDLENDPNEMHNLAKMNSQVCKNFKSQLTTMIQSHLRDYMHAMVGWSKDEERAIRDKLRTLGYLE